MDNSDREQQILDAAADLIIRHGYDKTTMGDVADAVGISRPLVYIHFKSKDVLLEALIVREMIKYGSALSKQTRRVARSAVYTGASSKR